MDENLINEQTPDRKYFTVIPNIVDDLNLSAAAFRLYVHLRRVAGEGGKCWQSLETLAKHCRMSRNTIVRAKRELVAAGLIKITPRKREAGGLDFHEIAIVDIWAQNMARYSGEQDDEAKIKRNTLQRSKGIPCKDQNEYLKKNQVKNGADDENPNIALRCRAPMPRENSRVLSRSAAGVDFRSQVEPEPEWYVNGKAHPAIKAWKAVTGHFPVKNEKVYTAVIATLGDAPDIERLAGVYANWVGRGYNPKNITGILQRFREHDYYTNPADLLVEAER